MTLVVTRTASDEDDARSAAITNAVNPDDQVSVEEMHWADATYPGGVRFLAALGGEMVGTASVGRIYMYPPDFDALWGAIKVLPQARRRGVGGALFEAISGVAREAGKPHLHVPVRSDRPDSIGFLARRGFTEYERSKTVRLDLTTPSVRAIAAEPPPDGVVLTTLAERPDLVPGIHAVALEAFPDIPSESEPIAAGDLEEFRARDVERPGIEPWGFIVAVEAATDRVVGYASLLSKPGEPKGAWHDMTAVARAWRGRGLARSLKVATIQAAMAHGLVILDTDNDVDNAPMRAVNAHLGYVPRPDSVTMRGPVAPGIMER